MSKDIYFPQPEPETEDKNADTINALMQQFALPEYIVFLIMGHVKELRAIEPDHVLVKAIEDVLADELEAPDENTPEQLTLDFVMPMGDGSE